jgi:hypothetical protein
VLISLLGLTGALLAAPQVRDIRSIKVPERVMAPPSVRAVSLRNTTTCVDSSVVEAEASTANGPPSLVHLSGFGRASDDKDKATIDSALSKMRSLDEITIACQPNKLAYVVFSGLVVKGATLEKGLVTIAWNERGATVLP